MTVERAPGHLSKASRVWWREVATSYELQAHQFRLLTAAAESWDRAQQAREILLAEGVVVTDRYDKPKAHPAVAIERDSRLAFARLCRELMLDPGDPDARPPRGRR